MVEQFNKPKPKIEPIESIEARRPIDKMENTQDVGSPEKVKFDSALEKMDPSKANIELRKVTTEVEKTPIQSPTLFDVAKASPASKIAPPSPESIKTAALSLRSKLEAPHATLISYEEKGVAIPKEFVSQLNVHIQHIDKALVDATSTVKGVEVQATSAPNATDSPAKKFLHYLTDSDKRLDTVVNEVSKAATEKQNLSPAKLLAVQMKVNFVSQELEFFTNVLNRSVETVKTLMNVQI